MNEIEPVTAEPTSTDVLAGAWSVERHLSPLALFDPNRTSICAQYQLALIDDSGNEARAHLAAARRHLQAATKPTGLGAVTSVNFASSLRSLCTRLDELSRSWD
jgi:hypothetical protein